MKLNRFFEKYNNGDYEILPSPFKICDIKSELLTDPFTLNGSINDPIINKIYKDLEKMGNVSKDKHFSGINYISVYSEYYSISIYFLKDDYFIININLTMSYTDRQFFKMNEISNWFREYMSSVGRLAIKFDGTYLSSVSEFISELRENLIEYKETISKTINSFRQEYLNIKKSLASKLSNDISYSYDNFRKNY